MSHPIAMFEMMNSSTSIYRVIRIKNSDALKSANEFRFIAADSDWPINEIFQGTAEALYESWAKGWRRKDGTRAKEFVIHTWTSTELVDGLIATQTLMGLDAEFPDDVDAFLEEDSWAA